MAHNIWLNYPVVPNISVNANQGKTDKIDGINYDGSRPVAYIEARGHGIFFEKYKWTKYGYVVTGTPTCN